MKGVLYLGTPDSIIGCQFYLSLNFSITRIFLQNKCTFECQIDTRKLLRIQRQNILIQLQIRQLISNLSILVFGILEFVSCPITVVNFHYKVLQSIALVCVLFDTWEDLKMVKGNFSIFSSFQDSQEHVSKVTNLLSFVIKELVMSLGNVSDVNAFLSSAPKVIVQLIVETDLSCFIYEDSVRTQNVICQVSLDDDVICFTMNIL